MHRESLALTWAFVSLLGCLEAPKDLSPDSRILDASATTTPRPDAAIADVLVADATTADASQRDASPFDASQAMDASVADAESTDANPLDSGPDDSGIEPPCNCDDGLYCNGLETCDVNGQCIAGTPPTPIDDSDPCTIPTVCNEATGQFDTINDGANPICVATSTAPYAAAQDYAYWYWPKNHRPVETWPVPEREMHFLTGHYGFVINEETGLMPHLGVLTDQRDGEESLFRENAVLEQFPSVDLRLEAGGLGSGIVATTFEGVTPTSVDRALMIDGGRHMNRLYVPSVSYAADSNLTGEFQIASMPRHFVLTHTLRGSSAAATTARIHMGGQAITDLPNVTWQIPDRAVTLTSTNGLGWHFIIYSQTGVSTTLTHDVQNGIRAQIQGGGGDLSISLLAIPTSAINADELELYLNPQTVAHISSTLLNEDGNPVRSADPATWDSSLGAFRLDLRTLQEAGGPNGPNFDQVQFHNWYGRHRIDIDTGGRGPIAVPLAFFGSNRLSWYITGGVAMLRDRSGEPLGLPVQISKNWHGQYWYHFYAHPTLSGASPETMEFTIASSRWGQAYAASHAQLSLVGWSDAGGHWDESALGAFGENVTYDPDVTLGRAMVDDVRPFLVRSDRKWDWTGNVGGADFLRYRTENEPYWIRRLARVRSYYGSPGPNLTDVIYAGVTTDGKIQGKIRTQLAATDDLVRVYFHLEYNFLADVAYDRLAFFQMAADRYGDNLFTKFAYGNAAGLVHDGQVPDHNTRGYASDLDRGIPLHGDAPWVMLYDNQRDWDSLPEQYADIGFVVRHFEANIGGTTSTTAHINIHRTLNGQSQYAFELGLPHESGSPWCGAACQGRTRFVPAGSTVRATIEYLVPPADLSRYYGANSHLMSLPASAYRSTQMLLSLARGNQLDVLVHTGTIARTYPIEVNAQPAAVAAELTVSGGLGYTPLTFHGLNHHDGWRLERQDTQGWLPLNYAVHGNDYWQSTFDADQQTWSQTFSVQNQGTNRYRLVWLPLGQR